MGSSVAPRSISLARPPLRSFEDAPDAVRELARERDGGTGVVSREPVDLRDHDSLRDLSGEQGTSGFDVAGRLRWTAERYASHAPARDDRQQTQNQTEQPRPSGGGEHVNDHQGPA